MAGQWRLNLISRDACGAQERRKAAKNNADKYHRIASSERRYDCLRPLVLTNVDSFIT